MNVLTAHYVGGAYPCEILFTAHCVEFIHALTVGDGVINAVNNLAPGRPTLNSSLAFVFAHASSLGSNEARLLREFNQYVSITPESEMHYGHGRRSSYLVILTLFRTSCYLTNNPRRSKTKLLLELTRISLFRLTSLGK